MAESLILVPGFFGFAHLGEVDYFASVAPIVCKRAGITRLVSLQPPPTGPLWRRVDALYRCVSEEIARGATRIHLVGHSTGGLDARLLGDPRYVWPGGPGHEERRNLHDHLGAIVSIAGPHRGTPMARRLRGTFESTIPVLFLASFLTKLDARGEGGARPIELGLRAWEKLGLLARSARAPTLQSLEALLPSIPTRLMPRATAEELLAYLGEIVSDHPLIHELTPLAMKNLNEQLERDRGAGPPLPVSYFVTVAPPPRFFRRPAAGHPWIDPALRGLYLAAFESTRFEQGEFDALPEAPWLGAAPPELESYAATAQDGIVPSASQVYGDRVEAVVFADHLDVVGHYPSAKHGGETLFDSGAAFDDARLEALWDAIGAVVAREAGRDGGPVGPVTG